MRPQENWYAEEEEAERISVRPLSVDVTTVEGITKSDATIWTYIPYTYTMQYVPITVDRVRLEGPIRLTTT